MKLLVSDYDGTLFTSVHGIKQNVTSVNKMINSGILFAIATGRSYSQIKRELDKYKVRYSYLICNDGAMTFNHKGDILNRLDIDIKTSKQVIDFIKHNKNVLRWHIDTGSIKTQDVTYVANTIIIKTGSNKIATKILGEIKEKVKDIHGYVYKNYINITNENNNKARAIDELNKYLLISDKDIYVIGNETNDISMVKRFSGYIMKSSNPDLRTISKKEVEEVRNLIDIIRNKIK